MSPHPASPASPASPAPPAKPLVKSLAESPAGPFPKPLDGIRVIDLTSVVLGPLATRNLADAGADVIKVESGAGDVLRHVEPSRSAGMGALFLNANRGKRSVVLDLKDASARSALIRLIEAADVFVHSLRPDAIARLGLTFEDLAAQCPRLVHCSAWGFGSDGPYRDRPAYDDIIQSLSGMSSLPQRAGQSDRPLHAPSALADKVAGMAVHSAILTALVARGRTGRGMSVEVPMLETLASFNLVEHLAGAVFVPEEGEAEAPTGYARLLSEHRRPHATRDGFLTVLPYTGAQWARFLTAAGRPDLADDERVRDGATRSREIGALYALVAELLPQRTNAEWMALLLENDVPAAPVNTLEDLRDDPHLAATDFLRIVDHPTEGRLRQTAPPVRYAGRNDLPSRPAPRLGEHTSQVLREAGLDEAGIDALLASGAATQAAPVQIPAPDRR